MTCILDGTIHGKIDQVQQILTLDTEPEGSARFTVSIHVQRVVAIREIVSLQN